jgi:predicted RNase H-like nuclease (RuvC/YqgF family)
VIDQFDVEAELSEFNLDRMHPTGKTNLIKVAECFGSMDLEAWTDFIDHGSLDLNAIAKELEIARSSLYQNEHIKRYILGKGEMLMSQRLISVLPYQIRNKPVQGNSNSHERYRATDKEITEKNSEIKHLHLQVAELSASLDGLKSELRAVKSKLEKADVRSHHLTQFGRYPR